MCGIAGTFDRNGSGESERRLSRRMTGMLAHRGPDGDGFYHRPVTGLDHRRIAIVHRAGSDQSLQIKTANQRPIRYASR
jgi:asparagine synthase (glutamine-hydrolysing)